MSGGLPAISKSPSDKLSMYFTDTHQRNNRLEYFDVFDMVTLTQVNRLFHSTLSNELSNRLFEKTNSIYKHKDIAKAKIQEIDKDSKRIKEEEEKFVSAKKDEMGRVHDHIARIGTEKGIIEKRRNESQAQLVRVQNTMCGRIVKYFSACTNRVIVAIVHIFRRIFSCIDKAFNIQNGLNENIRLDNINIKEKDEILQKDNQIVEEYQQKLMTNYTSQLTLNSERIKFQQRIIDNVKFNITTHRKAWDPLLLGIGGLKNLKAHFFDVEITPVPEDLTFKNVIQIADEVCSKTSTNKRCLVRGGIQIQTIPANSTLSLGEFLLIRTSASHAGSSVERLQMLFMSHYILTEKVSEKWVGKLDCNSWYFIEQIEAGRVKRFILEPDQMKFQSFFNRAFKYLESWQKTHPGKTLEAFPESETVEPCELVDALGDADKFLSLHFIQVMPSSDGDEMNSPLFSELTGVVDPIYDSWTEDRLDFNKKAFNLRKEMKLKISDQELIKILDEVHKANPITTVTLNLDEESKQKVLKTRWEALHAKLLEVRQTFSTTALEVVMARESSTNDLVNYHLVRGLLGFDHCLMILRGGLGTEEELDNSKIVYIALLNDLANKEVSEKEVHPSDQRYSDKDIAYHYPKGISGHQRLFEMIKQLNAHLADSQKTFANMGSLPLSFVRQLTLL